MDSAVARVVRASENLGWRACDGDGAVVGAAKALIRPDERCFVLFDTRRADAYAPLLAAIADELARDLYVTVDEADAEARGVHEDLGFTTSRRESEYLISTEPALARLRGVEAPAGFAFVGADEVNERRLRLLDDALRQDVPGTVSAEVDDTNDASTSLMAMLGARRTGGSVELIRAPAVRA